MRLLRTAIKAGIAAKLVQEARKPENQERLRRLWRQVTDKASSASS